MTTTTGPHRSLQEHLQEPSWKRRGPRDRQIASSNRQIDNLLDRWRIERREAPSSAGTPPQRQHPSSPLEQDNARIGLVQGVPEKPTAPDRSEGIQRTNRHAEVAAQVPTHRVAACTGPHPSDVGTTAAPQLPIGRYRRVPVQVHQADPDAPEVARRLIALIATRWPATPAEHVGSSAVPGLAGKNIIDLLLAAEPADIPAITQALLELGFQPQVPAAFPPTRPMLWGAFRHRATTYRVHVHLVPAGSPEVAAMRGFRDALRADPCLRRRYAALKRAIVAGGPADPVAFTRAKHEWIAATLTWLGLADHPSRRLYQDDLNPDNQDRAGAIVHPSRS